MNEEPAAVSRHGGWMIALGWAAAIATLFAFFYGVVDNRHNPNKLSSLTVENETLYLQKNADGHYLVEGTLNGKTATFLLDTGATKIAIPSSLAADAGLPRQRQQLVSTAGGNSVAYSTRIPRLTIGHLVFSDMRGIILPDMQGDVVLLGMNALQYLRITQQNGVLSLESGEDSN